MLQASKPEDNKKVPVFCGNIRINQECQKDMLANPYLRGITLTSNMTDTVGKSHVKCGQNFKDASEIIKDATQPLTVALQ